jgi:hypothetical protein
VTAPTLRQIGSRPLTPPITLSTDFSFQALFGVPTTDLEVLYRVVCWVPGMALRGSL